RSALVTRPRIVLADEPTANLDSATGQNIIGLMKEINRKNRTTFIFSTHDPMVMRQAERVIRMADGRIVGEERRAAEGAACWKACGSFCSWPSAASEATRSRRSSSA